MSSKASALMKTAQIEKTRNTIDQLLKWFSTKEQFYKHYVPIQQAILKRVLQAAEMTIGRLQQISHIVKEEKDLQALNFQKCQKNTLSNDGFFAPKFEQKMDHEGIKTKVEVPVWSSNVDRIFLSFSKHQKDKQIKMKKVYKTLESIHDSINKEEGRYKGELKKYEKQIMQFIDKMDDQEKEESKILGKLVKEAKNQQLKQSTYFIGQLKKIETLVMGQVACFAERGHKMINLIKIIIKLEKEVAKTIKDNMTTFLNYRKTYLGVDTKGEEEIYGQVSLCEDKVEQERVSYFNKVLLNKQRADSIQRILPKQEFKSNWQMTVKFLQTPKQMFSQLIRAEKEMLHLLKNISYKCWMEISLAQGWLIESYTPSIMYMTYDYIMLIYSKEGDLLKKLHTNSTKIDKIEGNTIFLKQKIKGFFTDSIQEYKIRFDEIQRLQEFQLFMENQI